jgi:hypothetical protein
MPVSAEEPITTSYEIFAYPKAKVQPEEPITTSYEIFAYPKAKVQPEEPITTSYDYYVATPTSISFYEPLPLSDSIKQSFHIPGEIISLADIIGFHYPRVETLSLSDVLLCHPKVPLAEVLLLSDSIKQSFHIPGEIISLADIIKFKYSIEDLLSLVDSLSLFPPKEILGLSDVVSTQRITAKLDLTEAITLSDITKQNPLITENLLLYDSVKLKKIVPDTYTICGAVWIPGGSEHPEPDVTVHLIKVSPRQNLIDYTTKTDENGYFEMRFIPVGEYIILAVKQGFTLGWIRVDLSEDTAFDLYISPISEEYVVERTYNQYGHIYKIYTFKLEETPTEQKIWGIIVFGDLYDRAAIKQVAASGYLEALTSGMTITLIATQFLDNQAFFEASESISQESATKILWTANVERRDFDGFTFYAKGPKTITLKTKLVIGEIPTLPTIPPYIPLPAPAPVPPAAAAGGDPSSGTTPMPAPQYNPPKKWVPGKYKIGLTERINLSALLLTKYNDKWMLDFKERLPIAANVNLHYLELFETLPISDTAARVGNEIFLTETLTLSDSVICPVEISMTGRAVVGNPIPGGIQEIPLAGATVIAYYKGTLKEAGRTTTDSNGFWTITGLPSETEFDIYIFKTGYTTVKGTVFSHDKDLIEERARIALESEQFMDYGTTYYYEAILSFLWLRAVEGGKIYGYVYNSRTLAKIKDTLVKVTDASTGDEYISISDETGYYEIIVPPGIYRVGANRLRYRPSKTYEGTIASNWNLNIPLDPVLPIAGGFYQRIGLRYVPSR